MRKIILASRSKARQKLLREVGLKFKVVPSSVQEIKSRRSSYGDLVTLNALRKAKDVASKFDSGVVIAADTIVISGKKIIGKPGNLKDAFRTIKTLSRSPQWVYSGLAVIDIDNNKTFADYDKTKIYMYPLKDKQIKSYLKKTRPLDKAGSFDIQGLGGIFIDRIEGCFYNVVGLPLAKLARILEKVGVDIFS